MAHRRTTPDKFQLAKELRHAPTPAEVKLWAYLRTLREDGIRFRRQHAIGPYIVDFCAPRQHLIVEVDGSQHLDQQEYDARRTRYLAGRGYHLLRFWNSEVMHKINGVIGVIQVALDRSSSGESGPGAGS